MADQCWAAGRAGRFGRGHDQEAALSSGACLNLKWREAAKKMGVAQNSKPRVTQVFVYFSIQGSPFWAPIFDPQPNGYVWKYGGPQKGWFSWPRWVKMVGAPLRPTCGSHSKDIGKFFPDLCREVSWLLLGSALWSE